MPLREQGATPAAVRPPCCASAGRRHARRPPAPQTALFPGVYHQGAELQPQRGQDVGPRAIFEGQPDQRRLAAPGGCRRARRGTFTITGNYTQGARRAAVRPSSTNLGGIGHAGRLGGPANAQTATLIVHRDPETSRWGANNLDRPCRRTPWAGTFRHLRLRPAERRLVGPRETCSGVYHRPTRSSTTKSGSPSADFVCRASPREARPGPGHASRAFFSCRFAHFAPGCPAPSSARRLTSPLPRRGASVRPWWRRSITRWGIDRANELPRRPRPAAAAADRARAGR